MCEVKGVQHARQQKCRRIKISDSGGLDLEAGCLDAGCWQDWSGLEEVTEGLGWMLDGRRGSKDFPHARARGARRIWTAIHVSRVPFKSVHLAPIKA